VWCLNRNPREILSFAQAMFAEAGRKIEAAGGRLTKAIGDAGLFVFPPEDADGVARAMIDFRAHINGWVAARGYPETATIRLNIGTVACGLIGLPSEPQLDIYGEPVNNAARLRGPGLALTVAFHARLSPEVAALFAEREDGNYGLA
jgi:class 3 adenylate cyclase